MLKHLKLHNLGPDHSLELTLSPRLNLITGDNGLGKSFLLDVAWWAMTRKWPAEINPLLTAGQKAIPRQPGEATIDFSFSGKSISAPCSAVSGLRQTGLVAQPLQVRRGMPCP